MSTYKLLITFLPFVLTHQIVMAQITPVKRNPITNNTNPAIVVNKASIPVSVINTTPPDLIIKDMILSTDKLSIKVLVENMGEGQASSGSISMKPDHSPNITKNVPSIAPHTSKWVTVPVPFNAYDFGEQYNAEVSIGTSGVKETNVSNNKFSFHAPNFSAITAGVPGSLPDLTIVEIREPKVIDGKNLLKVRIVNRGGTDAGGFYINFFYMIPNGGKEGGSVFLKSLKTGEEMFSVFELPMPDKFVYKYQGKLDPNSPPPPATLTIGDIVIGTVSCNTVPFNGGVLCDHVKYRVMIDSQNTVNESDDSNNVLWCQEGGANFKGK